MRPPAAVLLARTTAEPEALSTTALLLAAFDASASRPPARTLWPGLDVADLLVTPLVSGGERMGLLCAGAPPRRPFTGEDTEMARAIAHLAAIAIKRAELIEGLTNANIVKDLFEALAAGATTFAVAKATEVRCDLTKPYLMLCAEPAAGREQGSGEWRAPPRCSGADLAELAPRTAVEAGPGPVRAVLALGARAPQRIDEVRAGVPGAWPAPRRRDRAQRAARVAARLGPRLPAGARRDDDRRARCSATVARSATRRSARTGTSCTSGRRTRRTTGCGPPSIA